MARLKGIGSFLLVAGGVLVVLRLLHAGVPLFVADARPGPFTFGGLDEVEARMGFVPITPAYRPASLGERPTEIVGWYGPEPMLRIVWREEQTLAITQQVGGDAPSSPPTARALLDVPDSLWWQEGPMATLVVRRGDRWLVIETDLPVRDLRRMADTLALY